MFERIQLREVDKADLPELFKQQQEPEANAMAAFPPRDHDAFMAHWGNILRDSDVIKRTILADQHIAGHVICFERAGQSLIGYWLGRRFWGAGVASRAVEQFISSIAIRPLHAHVARHNLASIRVLEKCGFQMSGESRSAAPTGGDEVDELIYTLWH
ncbi:MAG TPA: GNAT family N-acetyltransferase [Pirellulales bacterium]